MIATDQSDIRVTHIITDLDVGGAEVLLHRLLAHTHGNGTVAEVISLEGDGPLVNDMRELGVTVHILHVARGTRMARAVRSIESILRSSHADVVQTWMYRADVFGGLAAKRAGIPVAWGLHAAPTRKTERLGLMTRMGLRFTARLSKSVPSAIVCCSHETRRVHAEIGYDADKLVVIPNGFEPAEPNESDQLRSELHLGPDDLLIGRVGRDHPQKDTPCLLAAFARVRAQIPEARLVLVGQGFSEGLIERAGPRDAGLDSASVHLLGPRSDVARLNSAFDVVVSSSYSEGLPVVLGEAMAVGTPVVATDVGDSALLIDDPARVVPPRDPDALAAAIVKVLSLDSASRKELGRRDRERVRSEYAFDRMVAAYDDLYRNLAQHDD